MGSPSPAPVFLLLVVYATFLSFLGPRTEGLEGQLYMYATAFLTASGFGFRFLGVGSQEPVRPPWSFGF